MTKRSFYQLLIFISIIAVATATFFYFKDDIVKFDVAEIINVDSIVARLPQINNIAKELEKKINLPGPLRITDGSPDVILTVDGVVLWTNQQRRLNGELSKLSSNDQLNAAAQAKVQDMFDNQYFDHYSPAGKGPGDFVDEVNYEFIKTGENLALGNFADDQELVQAWMDSPGHRENMLTPDFTEIGVAVAKGEFEGQTTWLAVQVFGRPLSACPQIDKNLKVAIDSNQTNLDTLKLEIDSLRKQIEQTRPRGRNRSQQKINQFNQIVDQYNLQADQYNSITKETQDYINQYNAQIKAFNDCANS